MASMPARVVALVVVGLGGVTAAGCSSGTPTSAPTTSTAPSASTSAPSTVPPSTAPPSTTTTTGAQTSACADGQIMVSAGTSGAGLGHEGQVLLFTNVSSSPCTLTGYPGVAGLDAQGAQVVQAVRTPMGYLGGLLTGSTTPPTVVLAPAAVASALAEGTDNPTNGATSCPTYPSLLVTAPDLTVSVRVAAGLPGCSPIEVHPVVPGTTGQAG